MKSSLEKLIKQSGTDFKWTSFNALDENNLDTLITEVNTLFTDPLQTYAIDRKMVNREEDLPNEFILLQDSPIYIHRSGINYLTYGNKIVEIEEILNQEIAFIQYYPKKITANQFISTIFDLYPKVNFFTLLTVPFVLIPAFYANLFNTRMIFNDFVYTLVFITFVFTSIWAIDYFIKYIIKSKHLSKMDENAIRIEDFLFMITPYITVPNIVSKIRMVESNRKIIWENISGVIMDLATILLIMSILVLLLGQTVVFLIIFYLIITLLSVFLRYRNYKIFIELEATQQDLLIERISYYKNTQQLRFFDMKSMQPQFKHQCKLAYKTDHDLSNFNFQWDEFVRFTSFLASFVLFVSIFFSAQEDTSVFNVLIALLIINGRASSSVIGLVTKSFYILVANYHLRLSAQEIFENVDEKAFKKGVVLEHIEDIVLKDVNVSVEGRHILEKVNVSFSRNNVYGFFGPVGSGKSTLMKVITQSHSEFSGGIVFNHLYGVEDLDRNYFSEKTVFIDSNSDFVKGSIYYNFTIRGMRDKNKIAAYCKAVFPFSAIDYEFIFQQDVSFIPMSTGQKKKLLLFMSINPSKQLIVLDEAFSNMSTMDVAYFYKMIKEQCRESIVFIVTHDRSLLKQLSFIFEIQGLNLLVSKSSIVKLGGGTPTKTV